MTKLGTPPMDCHLDVGGGACVIPVTQRAKLLPGATSSSKGTGYRLRAIQKNHVTEITRNQSTPGRCPRRCHLDITWEGWGMTWNLLNPTGNHQRWILVCKNSFSSNYATNVFRNWGIRLWYSTFLGHDPPK